MDPQEETEKKNHVSTKCVQTKSESSAHASSFHTNTTSWCKTRLKQEYWDQGMLPHQV